jgi:hypothetical protein
VWPLLIVLPDPAIDIGLQSFEAVVEPLAEGHAVELVLDRAVETLVDAVAMRSS